MWRKDKEHFQLVSRALGNIGIRKFLILGLREKKVYKGDKDTMETFYCLSAGDRADLIAAIRDIFLNSPGIEELLGGILYEIYHAEKKRMEKLLGVGANAHQPIAKA